MPQRNNRPRANDRHGPGSIEENRHGGVVSHVTSSAELPKETLDGVTVVLVVFFFRDFARPVVWSKAHLRADYHNFAELLSIG